MEIKTEKTFFLIPGFKQKAMDAEFIWLEKFLEKNNFRVAKVPIRWKYGIMSDYVQSFREFFNKHKSKSNFVFGFSYGAVIALVTANELKPKKIYLCSLSPDFKEDAAKMKPWVRKLIGIKRFQDIKKRSGRMLAKKLKIPSVIFYGELEAKTYPQLKVRCEETAKFASRSKLVVVKDASHKINHPEYIKSIRQEINKIF